MAGHVIWRLSVRHSDSYQWKDIECTVFIYQSSRKVVGLYAANTWQISTPNTNTFIAVWQPKAGSKNTQNTQIHNTQNKDMK